MNVHQMNAARIRPVDPVAIATAPRSQRQFEQSLVDASARESPSTARAGHRTEHQAAHQPPGGSNTHRADPTRRRTDAATDKVDSQRAHTEQLDSSQADLEAAANDEQVIVAGSPQEQVQPLPQEDGADVDQTVVAAALMAGTVIHRDASPANGVADASAQLLQAAGSEAGSDQPGPPIANQGFSDADAQARGAADESRGAGAEQANLVAHTASVQRTGGQSQAVSSEAVPNAAPMPGTSPLAASNYSGARDPTPDLQLARTYEPDVDQNIARVARGLRSALSQNGGTVTLRLHPPELGAVRIQLQITGGTVTAQFQTEHASVRDLLAHQMGQLRHALQTQGLVIDRLEVQRQPLEQSSVFDQRDEDDGRSRGRYEDDQNQQPPNDQRDEPTGAREGDAPAGFDQTMVQVAD